MLEGSVGLKELILLVKTPVVTPVMIPVKTPCKRVDLTFVNGGG